MDWEKEGINYWENPDCPTGYLAGALVALVEHVEGVNLPINYFNGHSREEIAGRIAFYESVADK